MYKIYRNFIFALLKLFSLVESSRGSSCRLLNLLFEDEDALPLLRGQHGNLFWGQLQDLHDQGGLEREYKPAINFLKEHNSSSVLLDGACFLAVKSTHGYSHNWWNQNTSPSPRH